MRFTALAIACPAPWLLAAVAALAPACSDDRKQQKSDHESADAVAPASGPTARTPLDATGIIKIGFATEETAVCSTTDENPGRRRAGNRLRFAYSLRTHVLHGHWFCAPDLDVTVDDADAGGLEAAIARLTVVDAPRTAAPEDCTSHEMVGTPPVWTIEYEGQEPVNFVQVVPQPCKDGRYLADDGDLIKLAWTLLER